MVGKKTFAGLRLGRDEFIGTLMRVFNCVFGSFDSRLTLNVFKTAFCF